MERYFATRYTRKHSAKMKKEKKVKLQQRSERLKNDEKSENYLPIEPPTFRLPLGCTGLPDRMFNA